MVPTEQRELERALPPRRRLNRTRATADASRGCKSCCVARWPSFRPRTGFGWGATTHSG